MAAPHDHRGERYGGTAGRDACPFTNALLALAVLVTAGWTIGARGAVDAKPPGDVLDAVERKIGKEPEYQSAPQYVLLVLGRNAQSKVWLVEDGKLLYVDKNANGDLTDDGPPVAQTHLRHMGPGRYDCDYLVDSITPAGGGRHTELRLARWNYGDKEDRYGLFLKLDGKTPMYAGWTSFWAARPDEAPVMHFGGPLRPTLLRLTERALGPEFDRLSVAFVNDGRGRGATTRLAIEAVPPQMTPEVRVEWPVAQGAASLRTSHRLESRCCYWEFYDMKFKPPAGAVSGKARVSVIVPPGALPLDLATDTIEVPLKVRSEATRVARDERGGGGGAR
jgi:hypothetical protein